MSQKSAPFPELRETSRFVLERSGHDREPVKELDQLRLARHTELIDSTAGVVNVKLPLAASSQGVWFAIVKISADGNNVNAVRKGADLVNGGTSKLVGAAQYAHMIFGNDGVSNWFQIA